MILRKSVIGAVALMVAATAMGYVARPSAKVGDRGPAIQLASMVPQTFGTWHEVKQAAQVVNPQTQEMLNKLYSQQLERTYVNDQGYMIMLSLAYGDDQRGTLQAHKPEVCYPAQGFVLRSNVLDPVRTNFGSIEARRLDTRLGPRNEPVTYWFTIGGSSAMNKYTKRWAEINMALTGQVPDGLLFRISSIDEDPKRAFQMQDRFAQELLKSVSSADRLRLAGIAPAVAGAPAKAIN